MTISKKIKKEILQNPHLILDDHEIMNALLSLKKTNTNNIVDIRDIKDVAPYLTFDQGLAFPTSFSSSLDYLVDSLSVDFDNGTSTFTESALPTADMGTLPTA